MEADRSISLKYRRLVDWCHFLPLGAIALTRHLVSGSAQADFAIYRGVRSYYPFYWPWR